MTRARPSSRAARVAVLAVLAVLALVVVGCASGPDPAPVPVPVAAPAPAPARSPSAVPVAVDPVDVPARPAPRTTAPRPRPSSPPAQGTPRRVAVTFYAAADNDPPGSTEIAHPNARHSRAGGAGSYADPLTLATDPRELRAGTRVYYPTLKRYYVMEDDCAQCIEDWSGGRSPHVDLWLSATTDPAVEDCEAALTPDGTDAIVVDPPPGLPVDTSPLWSRGRCARR